MRKNKRILLPLLLISLAYKIHSLAAIIPLGTKLAPEQVLNKDNASEPSSLDPSLCNDILGSNILHDLFEGLVIENANGQIVPGVATHWKISKDGLKYTFFLRNNAKWSDGSKVTAQDFVYSFRRFVDPKTAAEMVYLASNIKNARNINNGKAKPETLGINAIDQFTVEITLEAPAAYFLGILAGANFVPLKKDIIDKYGAGWTQPNKIISNGAYKLVEWKVGEKTTLEKNNFYWDSKNTIIRTVNNFVIQDKFSSLRMFESGQIDWTYGVPPGMFQNLNVKYPKEMQSSQTLSVGYINFNTTKAPLNNKKLREALSIVINREQFTKYVMGRNEQPIYDLPPYGIVNYTQYVPLWSKLSEKELIAKAQKLYEEAGFSSKNPAKIRFTYATNETEKKYSTALAAIWQKTLGVKTELFSEEWKVHLENTKNKNYDVTLRIWSADYNDAQNFLGLLLSDNVQNITGYNNKKFDNLILKAEREVDIQKRKTLLSEASKIAMDDFPVSPLFSDTKNRLIRTYVQGMPFNNPQDNYRTKEFYIAAHDKIN